MGEGLQFLIEGISPPIGALLSLPASQWNVLSIMSNSLLALPFSEWNSIFNRKYPLLGWDFFSIKEN